MPSVGTWSGSVVITGIIPMGDGGFFWKSTKHYILYCSRVVPAVSLLRTFWANQLENPTARIHFHKHPSCEFQKPWKKSIGSEQKTPLHQHTIQYIGNNWNARTLNAHHKWLFLKSFEEEFLIGWWWLCVNKYNRKYKRSDSIQMKLKSWAGLKSPKRSD